MEIILSILSSQLPKLTISRKEAKEKLVERISALKTIQEIQLTSNEVVKLVAIKIKSWDEYADILLNKIFTSNSFAEKIKITSEELFEGDSDTVASIGIKWYTDRINKHILEREGKMQSIIEQLDLIDEGSSSGITNNEKIGNDVFIVHGHDNEAKQETARFIEKLNLKAVILHERPNKGRTVIEKLVEESQNAGYAIILLTPDDIGFVKGEEGNPEERARQNVVLELGYFVGKLSRERVCLLLKGGTEIPNDFSGVVYTPMDNAGKWKYDIANEMKEVGFQINLEDIS